MQAPGLLNLSMYQGASWDYTLTWQTGGTPVNLSGYSARMQVRESYDSVSPVLSLTAGTGITSPTDGQVLKYQASTGLWINGSI